MFLTMKYVLFFFVIILINVLNIDGGIISSYLYSRYIKCDHFNQLHLDVSGVQVFFYDFANDYNITSQIFFAADLITSPRNLHALDMTRKLILFVPGYKSHIHKKTEELVRQTFKTVPDTNLIIIDHSEYTHKQGGKVASYERSVFYTYYIAQALAKFLAELHKKGYPSKNIHAIGHSLGSQILGYTGTAYTKETNEKLWRITGIDPAGPCFSNSPIDKQIRSGVAEYVEVYHCNAGGLGTTSVLADADFFLNSEGRKQPHCSGSFIPGVGATDVAKCSHNSCVRYWMETVHHPGWYLAWACDSYKDFKAGRCAGNEVTIAGYSNPGNATGVFYVSTETNRVF